jgi:hypothetical protein
MIFQKSPEYKEFCVRAGNVTTNGRETTNHTNGRKTTDLTDLTDGSEEKNFTAKSKKSKKLK